MEGGDDSTHSLQRCPTLCSSTTYPPTSSQRTTMPPVQSTDTSVGICKTQDGPGTNIPAGDEKTPPSLKRSTTQTSSQPASKPDSQVQVRAKSFKLYTLKDDLVPFMSSAEEEAAKVAAELKAYHEVITQNDEAKNESQSKKKRKVCRAPYVLTPEHEDYRHRLDAFEMWEKELTTVHGLSKSEAGLVSDIVGKYGQSESFPEEDPDESSKHMQLARPGWEQFRSMTSIFQEHVLPTGWLHKKDPKTGKWTVVKMGAP